MKLTCLAIVGSLMATGVAPAHGATILSQIVDDIPSGLVSGEGIGRTFQVYDDFRLSGSTSIDTLTWWGFPVAYDEQQPTHFTVSVRGADADGLPDADQVYFSQDVTVHAMGEPDRAMPNAPDIFYSYRFSVQLGSPVILPGDTDLYLSVFSNDLLHSSGWVWASSSFKEPDPGAVDQACSVWDGRCVIMVADGRLQDYSVEDLNMAWELAGTQLTGPVPEPTTWAMMLVGFGSVGAGLRRRRARSTARRGAGPPA